MVSPTLPQDILAGIIPRGLAGMMLKEQVAAAVAAAAKSESAVTVDGVHLRRSHQSAAAAIKVWAIVGGHD